MAYYDLKTVNTALTETLEMAIGIERAQNLDELTENVPEMDLPMIQVVPDSWNGTSFSQTHLNTFAGKGTDSEALKARTWIYSAYVYIARLPVIREAFDKMVTVAAALTEVIDAQQKAPLFGSEAIRSFQYSAERVVVDYSGADYLTIHYTFTLSIW